MSLSPRVRPLTAVELPDLPLCGGSCPALSADSDWARATQDRYGWCGVRVCRDDVTVGYLLLAAPGLAPLRGPFFTTPLSDDAAGLVRVWVAPAQRGHGVGRHLVQRSAALAHRAGLPAIEAIAGVETSSCAVPPLPWLRRAGFTVTRNHPLHPRVRLDLERTVAIPPLAALVDRIRTLVHGPQAPPQPTGRAAGRTAGRTAGSPARVDVLP